MPISPAETGWTGMSGIVGGDGGTPTPNNIKERDGDIICDRAGDTIIVRQPPFTLLRRFNFGEFRMANGERFEHDDIWEELSEYELSDGSTIERSPDLDDFVSDLLD